MGPIVVRYGTPVTGQHRKLTQAELVDEAAAAFGDDPRGWAFRCPRCGDVATIGDFAAGDTDGLVGQECIGRSLGALDGPTDAWTGRGCNWTAYGLFPGPWEIVMPDGRSVWSFPLAV